MELNREQIVKALECCSDGGRCNDCPYDSDCFIPHWGVVKYALALIRELTEENERLEAGMMKHIAVGQRERTTVVTKSHIDKVYKDGFKDGVRKMQERLEMQRFSDANPHDYAILHAVIDRVAEKLLEEGT